jgi:hypothetical protein
MSSAGAAPHRPRQRRFVRQGIQSPHSGVVFNPAIHASRPIRQTTSGMRQNSLISFTLPIVFSLLCTARVQRQPCSTSVSERIQPRNRHSQQSANLLRSDFRHLQPSGGNRPIRPMLHSQSRVRCSVVGGADHEAWTILGSSAQSCERRMPAGADRPHAVAGYKRSLRREG